MNPTSSNQTLLDGICRRGVLVSTSVRYWRGCKRLNAEDLGLDTHRDLQGVYRYYELAKRAEWQVRDLAWGEIPPIPEYSGSPQKLARRRDLWRSVITQQLQADELAPALRQRAGVVRPELARHRGQHHPLDPELVGERLHRALARARLTVQEDRVPAEIAEERGRVDGLEDGSADRQA